VVIIAKVVVSIYVQEDVVGTSIFVVHKLVVMDVSLCVVIRVQLDVVFLHVYILVEMFVSEQVVQVTAQVLVD